MNDRFDSVVFSGVSATPNVLTHLVDRARDCIAWLGSWTFAGLEGSWSAQPGVRDPDAPSPNELYFH